ncbi:hypothetical protein SARC_10683 [Sphaeroforma arctica JP610]|uniref:Uncharacterized protein n=1 Tax=Sphaeroforma arctica JP610 TaxID=667725 RepID=A0A0L0FK29_9EUKA|nr:hypothetical protein SARC_10683 [Sphaeroforma arctica JP610]KNC76841.1 hypothetical protein SARC_10683 [Sphaeroforma arctica JP610]|eukprot:XP_014150743.1 hypothetical protein SARC_10683 [Sphaeroforma arctica JP610]
MAPLKKTTKNHIIEMADDNRVEHEEADGTNPSRLTHAQRRQAAEDIFDHIEQQGYASFKEGPESVHSRTPGTYSRNYYYRVHIDYKRVS